MEIRQRLDQPDESEERPVSGKDKLLDDPDYKTVWNVLSHDPKPADIIIEQTGLSAREVSSMLLMMELKGLVQKQGNGHYLRA
jgi:DNA processing protein